jgi:hypothetical protein
MVMVKLRNDWVQVPRRSSAAVIKENAAISKDRKEKI